MRPHHLIIFLLLWLATPLAAAQARLTLGIAPADTPGLASAEQARQLADALGKGVGEEVALRVFNSRGELDQWLVKFSMIDLAIYDEAFLASQPGKYLVIGTADATGKLFIVSRQGVAGDLPQRVAKALQHPLAASNGKAAAKAAQPPTAPQPRPAAKPPVTTPTSEAVTAPVRQSEPAVIDVKPEPAAEPARQRPQVEAETPPPEPPLTAAKPAPQLPLPKAEGPAAPALSTRPAVRQEGTEASAPAQLGKIKSLRGDPPPVTPPPPLVFPELPAMLESPPTSPEAVVVVPVVPVVPETLAEPVKVGKRIKPLTPAEPAPAAVPEPAAAAASAAATPATEPQAEPPVPTAVASAAVPAATVDAETPAEAIKTGKRIKPLTPAEPAPATIPETAAAIVNEPAEPAAEPQETVPAPIAVETPVKTVSVTRPEPAGVTPPPSPQPSAPQSPAITQEVPAVIAQPDIPQELRPPGVPTVRPSRLPTAPLPKDDVKSLLTAKLPEKIGRTQKPEPLLPPPDPEPGIVYVVPFITLMVPDAVRERIFDQFVDKLNESGANRKLRFVILKEPLEKIDRQWLDARKYVFGEIFGYVEESGCCSTDLRAKARLTYYRSHHPQPSLRYEFPIRTFFDHNKTSIEIERQRLADQIANALVSELTKALQP